MPPVRHLANAPIREALLDVRVDLSPEFSASVFRGLGVSVGPGYPKVTEGTKVQASLKLDPRGTPFAESQEFGLHAVHYEAEDGRTVAQFRTDGFTLNRLKPYTKWDEIFPEAMRLWRVFVGVAGRAAVTRVAVRYINEFDLDSVVPELGRYLGAIPGLPPGAPGRAKGFLTRVSTEDVERKLTSVVTYSVKEHATERRASVVLDIDVACTHVPDPSPEGLAPIFTLLRATKNQIFFDSLTEETLARFE